MKTCQGYEDDDWRDRDEEEPRVGRAPDTDDCPECCGTGETENYEVCPFCGGFGRA